ncbi:hypothetical protein B5X24_HaOG214301 [Helicoverpa armigera]|nr:hypothetical protein B5X24_HaOG214301 [Helicoverpa armigera]
MVARTDESMFGCYGDSYSYRLWSLANVWGACRFRPLAGGGSEGKPSEEEEERGGSPLGPGGPFSCSQCRGAYPTREQLERHETLHAPNTQCLVMNLKMGRIKPNNPALNPERSPSRKRTNAMVASQLNNNISTNGNSFLPMPAAFFASMSSQENFHRPTLGQPGIPFYMPPGMPMSPAGGIAPYSIPATLSQFLEQLASSQYQTRKIENLNSPTPITPQPADPEDLIEEVTEDDDKRSEGSAELVMDIEDEESVLIKKEQEERDTEARPASSDFESVPLNKNEHNTENPGFNSILQSVSASVTKHFFQANLEKLSPVSGNVCPSIESPSAPHVTVKEELEDTHRCSKCNLTFTSKSDLLDHEKVLCGNMFRKHEGLAAQVAETVALNRLEAEIHASIQHGISASEDEDFNRDDRDDKISIHDNDRKIRVRTALSEEQQIVLKEHYALNPRPNREEFKRIAQQIGLDNRVVQVWFQNNRARERRMTQTMTTSDQPLDLSTKKSNPSVTSSPSPSPPCSISVTHSDSEEAVNLSQKSSRSTTPHRTNYLNTYPHSNCSSSSFTDFRLSPSPGEPINGHKRLLPQKIHVNPLVPMDKLLQYNDMANARSPILNMHLTSDINRQGSSPSYDRAPWDEMQAPNETEDEATVLKKSKLKQGADIKEGEGQFVCDQCDKTFVKQSSLARHKYEHSVQGEMLPHRVLYTPRSKPHNNTQ